MLIYETERYVVVAGEIVPGDTVETPQYVVKNKETETWEFWSPVLYFARDWADQMTGLLERQDNPPPEAPPEAPLEETGVVKLLKPRKPN